MTQSRRLRPGRLGDTTSARPRPQKKPKWTSIDHIKGFENVLGYSGTNSKYVNIHDNDFYNNGVGIVPEHARLGAL